MSLRIAFSLFLTGLVLGAGPCAVSCGPFLVSYILGASRTIRAGLVLYAVFVTVRLLVYSLVGWGIGLWGEAVVARHLGGGPTAVILVFLGVLCVGMGVHQARAGQAHQTRSCSFRASERMDIKAAILFGLVVALTPCAPLLGIFGYVVLVSDVWWKGVLFMTAFGLGTALSPVILLCAGAGRCVSWAERRPRWARALNILGASAMVVMGSWVLYKGLEALI